MEQIKQCFIPPYFSNHEQSRQAYLLHVFLWAVTLVALTYIAYIFLFARERVSRIPYLIPIIIVTFLCQYWMRHKRLSLASYLFVVTIWSAVTLAVFTGGGVQALAYPSYTAIILLAGLILGTRTGFGVVILSSLAGLVMVYLEEQGKLPPFTLSASFTTWLVDTLYFWVVAVALYLALDTVNKVLGQAQQEIKERKQIEAALRTSQERYRRLVDEAQDIVSTVGLDGNISSLNPAFEYVLGWPREEWLGHPVMALIHPDDLAKAEERGKQVMEGEALPPAEYRLRAQSGEYVDVELSTTLQIEDDQVVGTLSIIRDITQRKATEEALREAQKLDSLGLLAGGVAHDFNNLLVALLGQTSLALYQLPQESPVRRPIQKAVQAAERAADLTRQLLAYSGRGKFMVSLVNLNELIDQNLHLFSVVIEKQVNLRREFAPDLPAIEADTGQMQQVVMNLILNAVQAIGEKPGTITIVTGTQRLTEADGRYWQHTSQTLLPGLYVTLEIHDTGHGMEEAVRQRLFEPFFSTKAIGRGLGLAAVLGILRGHHGGIRVYSEPGQGTTFKLLFPAVQHETASPQAAPQSVLPSRSGLVLVIDDELPVCEAVSDILNSIGVDVLTASSGAAGLALMRAYKAEVSLVLLDLSMPGLSGEDTFRALQQEVPQVPVILSSGYNEIEATRRFAGKGLAGFLQKPYDFEMLINKVQAYL